MHFQSLDIVKKSFSNLQIWLEWHETHSTHNAWPIRPFCSYYNCMDNNTHSFIAFGFMMSCQANNANVARWCIVGSSLHSPFLLNARCLLFYRSSLILKDWMLLLLNWLWKVKQKRLLWQNELPNDNTVDISRVYQHCKINWCTPSVVQCAVVEELTSSHCSFTDHLRFL